MKNKFQRLTKEEQKQAIEEYISIREQNGIVVKKLKNLRIISILGIIYSLLSFVWEILGNSKYIYYLFDGILLVMCVVFFIQSKKMLESYVNEYLVNKQKNELKAKRKAELEEENKK